ncbi:MAG TPA: hypothetical protein VFL96_02210 [Acidobacteriaceae bacterium]|nr:hypothetical protein [Acidobacteriaceae bacterium]
MQVSEILSEIDSEIARLQEARRLLAGDSNGAATTRGRKPAAAAAAAAPKKRRRRRKLTPEGRKRLSEALKARWAERKKKAAKASK